MQCIEECPNVIKKATMLDLPSIITKEKRIGD
jgi:hypothetical protein